MNNSQLPLTDLTETAAHGSAAESILNFMKPIFMWIFIIFLIGFLLLMATIIFTLLAAVFVMCFQYLKGDKKEESKDVELASQTDTEEGTSTWETACTNIRGA
jgi:predicted membrane protein